MPFYTARPGMQRRGKQRRHFLNRGLMSSWEVRHSQWRTTKDLRSSQATAPRRLTDCSKKLQGFFGRQPTDSE